jgi:hypothetical protein
MFAEPQHRGELQDCLLVCYAAAWPPTPKSIRVHSAWALEVPDHAAARLLQRAPEADLRAALFEAGLAFVAADAAVVAPRINCGAHIYLRVGPGAFVANVVGGKTPDGSRIFIFARAQTWLHHDMLGPDQTLLPSAATPESSVAWDLWHWGQTSC